jgi:hypothetical protein
MIYKAQLTLPGNASNREVYFLNGTGRVLDVRDGSLSGSIVDTNGVSGLVSLLTADARAKFKNKRWARELELAALSEVRTGAFYDSLRIASRQLVGESVGEIKRHLSRLLAPYITHFSDVEDARSEKGRLRKELARTQGYDLKSSKDPLYSIVSVGFPGSEVYVVDSDGRVVDANTGRITGSRVDFDKDSIWECTVTTNGSSLGNVKAPLRITRNEKIVDRRDIPYSLFDKLRSRVIGDHVSPRNRAKYMAAKLKAEADEKAAKRVAARQRHRQRRLDKVVADGSAPVVRRRRVYVPPQEEEKQSLPTKRHISVPHPWYMDRD